MTRKSWSSGAEDRWIFSGAHRELRSFIMAHREKSLTLFRSSSSSQFAPVPIREPPPLLSSNSLPVRGSGWPRCLPQALRAPTLIRSLSYTRVPNSFTLLLPPIRSLGCFSSCAHQSSRSGLLDCTRIWEGGWSGCRIIPSDRRRNHHLLHLIPAAVARSLAGSRIFDLDWLLYVYHTSVVSVWGCMLLG